MKKKNLFELYSAGKLPLELQKETEGFALNGKNYSEQISRKGLQLQGELEMTRKQFHDKMEKWTEVF